MIGNKDKGKQSTQRQKAAGIHSSNSDALGAGAGGGNTVVALKNQVNLALPFKERKGLHNTTKQTTASSCSGRTMKMTSQMVVVAAAAPPFVNMISSPTNSRQVKECQTLLLNSHDSAANGSSTGAQIVTVMTKKQPGSSLKNDGLASTIRNYKASFKNVNRAPIAPQQIAADTPTQQFASQQILPLSKNKMRSLKASSIHKSFHQQVVQSNGHQAASGKGLKANTRPLEDSIDHPNQQRGGENSEPLDFFHDNRRSFSPCQMPSKALFIRESLGCSRPSMLKNNQPQVIIPPVEFAIRLPGAQSIVGSKAVLTDPTAVNYKTQASEQRKQLWQKTRSKELSLPSASGVGNQALSKASVSFKNGVANQICNSSNSLANNKKKPSSIFKQLRDQDNSKPNSIMMPSTHHQSQQQLRPQSFHNNTGGGNNALSGKQTTAAPQAVKKTKNLQHKLLQTSKHASKLKKSLREQAGGVASERIQIQSCANLPSSKLESKNRLGSQSVSDYALVSANNYGSSNQVTAPSLAAASSAAQFTTGREMQQQSSSQIPSSSLGGAAAFLNLPENFRVPTQGGFEPLIEVDSMEQTPASCRGLREKDLTRKRKQSNKLAEVVELAQQYPLSQKFAISPDIRKHLKAKHLGHVIERESNASSHLQPTGKGHKHTKNALFKADKILSVKQTDLSHNFVVDSSVPLNKLLPKCNSQQRVHNDVDGKEQSFNAKLLKPLTQNNSHLNTAAFKTHLSPKISSQISKLKIKRDKSLPKVSKKPAQQETLVVFEDSVLKTEVSPQSKKKLINSSQQFLPEEGEQVEQMIIPAKIGGSPPPAQKDQSKVLKSPKTAARQKRVNPLNEQNAAGTSTRRQNHSIDEDEFILNEQRVRDKLAMFQEKDQKKVIQKLSQQLQSQQSKKLSHQFSTLMPVQNYTSTNDDLYKETIEARRIREAVGKMSNSLKHPPISIVEKKKHQRIINQIEQNVTNRKYGDNQHHQLHSDLQLAMLGSPAAASSGGGVFSQNKQRKSAIQALSNSALDDSSPPAILKSCGSPSPCAATLYKQKSTTSGQKNKIFSNHSRLSPSGKIPAYMQQKDEEINFFMTDTGISSSFQGSQQMPLPVYTEPAESQPLQLNQINEESTHRNCTKSLNSTAEVQVETTNQPIVSELAFPHKTLSVLMKKAAKFDRESKQARELTKQIDEEKEGLVRLAEKFTTKEHFQKTFMRQSDTTNGFQNHNSSPNRTHQHRQQLHQQTQGELQIPQSQSLEENNGKGHSTDRSHQHNLSQSNHNGEQQPQTKNESPLRQTVAEKEDRSFFMRIQRQYSQKQLMLTQRMQNSNSKEPLLLYANKPQIIRKDAQSPSLNDFGAISNSSNKNKGSAGAVTSGAQSKISPQRIAMITSKQQQLGKAMVKNATEEQILVAAHNNNVVNNGKKLKLMQVKHNQHQIQKNQSNGGSSDEPKCFSTKLKMKFYLPNAASQNKSRQVLGGQKAFMFRTAPFSSSGNN